MLKLKEFLRLVVELEVVEIVFRLHNEEVMEFHFVLLIHLGFDRNELNLYRRFQ